MFGIQFSHNPLNKFLSQTIMTNSHNNITCPKCHSAFPIDKSDYALISQQVRTKEFNSELEKKVQSEVSQHKKILEQELSSKFKLELKLKESIRSLEMLKKRSEMFDSSMM